MARLRILTNVDRCRLKLACKLTQVRLRNTLVNLTVAVPVGPRGRSNETVRIALSAYIFHRNDGKPILEFRKSWHSACVAAGVGGWVCASCKDNEGKYVFELDAKNNCPRCRKHWKSEDRKYSGRLFHDLRRSAVRDMISARCPQDDAMSISGHETDAMFRRYNIRNKDDAKRALKRTREYRRTLKENVVVMAATGD